MMGRTDELPVVAAVEAPVNAIESYGCDDLRIAGRERNSAYGLPMHTFKRAPGTAAIRGAEKIAGIAVHAPASGVDTGGIGGINAHGIKHVVIATEMRITLPVGAAIARIEK